jgi:hypothetical protein
MGCIFFHPRQLDWSEPGGDIGVWLSQMLPEADHRWHHVQVWAARRPETVSRSIDQTVGTPDFSGDRLAEVLRTLRGDAQWTAFKVTLVQRLLLVYTLPAECMHLDDIRSSGYWSVTSEAGMTLAGLYARIPQEATTQHITEGPWKPFQELTLTVM